MTERDAKKRILPGAALIDSGLLCLNGEPRSRGLAGEDGYVQLPDRVRRVMHGLHRSRRAWVAAVLGEPLVTSLAWENYEHLGPVRDLAAKVIAGGVEVEAKGLNLLLHGPVGTGKTEFSKTLAARMNLSIWSVGEKDDVDGEPNRTERLAALRLTQHLLAKRGRAIILLDEAEDVLSSGDRLFGRRSPFGGGSKVFVNRLLERNPVPIIWTCNDVDGIDPAVLRRMTLALEVKTPSQPVRARIWRAVLADVDMALDADAVRRLSGRYAVPPALAASAARAAALARGGEPEIEQALGGIIQILGIEPTVVEAEGRRFDPDLANCREDLVAFVERLAQPGAPLQWSLCLHGAPGTGKSQFARYVAARLGLEVMQKRASDLLSMWLGDSEKRIAAAFQEARAQRSILVIDEADSLLADRRDAVRSWEVTQVNEMLTWMENHPLPFICTTNLMDRLDRASLRRFTFKLRFDALTGAQSALAFERFFGVPAPRPLADGLTPGDFATVRRKQEVFGTAATEVLADWLDEEVQAKGGRAAAIGFRIGCP
jgi:SpoVK/Ycf46/Vps4 family AAA+-type ATPase